jgi:hypothetical protein
MPRTRRILRSNVFSARRSNAFRAILVAG